jgi:uncharacterized small protein (DUF1192 family)
MSAPLTIGLASTAVGLVNGTISLLKEAKQAAKQSEDHNLKDKLSEIFDSVLDLKEVVGCLRDENADLRAQLARQKELRWDGAKKLYFREDDSDPFCPSCFDLNGRHIRLQPSIYSSFFEYVCKVCQNEFVLK